MHESSLPPREATPTTAPEAAVDVPAGQAVYDYRSSLAMDNALYSDFVSAMVDRGVRIIPRGNWFLSTAHEEADVDATLAAVDDVFANVLQRGRA